ncbi:MAG: DUF3052 domain-containing protein [Vicinamibacteria bacterium]|nr:DUF3052 domain-containing protein [Vicinamibacteria bacterium]
MKQEEVRYPKPVIDKLGVKPGQRVSVLGLPSDAPFRAQVAERAAKLSWGRLLKDNDLVFVAITSVAELSQLPRLREAIVPDGAIWPLWPKGRKELREDDVRAAALASGLVDVKVVAFSEILSALKLMIPVAHRPQKRSKQ